jgi:hypothetical protein
MWIFKRTFYRKADKAVSFLQHKRMEQNAFLFVILAVGLQFCNLFDTNCTTEGECWKGKEYNGQLLIISVFWISKGQSHKKKTLCNLYLLPVFLIRIRRIRKILGLPDLDLFVRDPNPNLDQDPFIITQKDKENPWIYSFFTSLWLFVFENDLNVPSKVVIGKKKF